MARSQVLRDALRVKPGSRIHLERMDAGATFGHDKESSVAATVQQMERLRSLQDRMWAEAKHSVLVVLQGIDAAGKDGTIAKVMEAFNPQGCPVTSFKVPTPEELGHDFLWRVHRHTPRKGEVGIFNRSHYEDVLVVRVHGFVPRKVWSTRYDQINDFEEMLTRNGTTIVKFFLTIDRDEQRKLWDDYQAAFDEALNKTSTPSAPWYVIPANRNWFRNLAVATILADTMADLKPAYPPEPDLPPNLVIE